MQSLGAQTWNLCITSYRKLMSSGCERLLLRQVPDLVANLAMFLDHTEQQLVLMWGTKAGRAGGGG